MLSLVNVQTVLPAGITYDAASHTLSLDPTNAAFQSLAQGQIGTYAVSFGVTDGTVTTAANAVFTVIGVNDAPIIVAPIVGTANEDGALANLEPLLSVTDVDTLPDSLKVVNVPAILPPGVTFDAARGRFSLNPSNAAFQSLSLGETMTYTIPIGISDGFATVAATATYVITGTNDAPVVSGVVSGGTTTAQGAPMVLNLLSKASDIDHLDVLNVNLAGGNKVTAAVTSGTWTAPVAFTVANNQLTIDPRQFASLAAGTTLGLTFNYQVTDGNPGGSVAASATMAIQGNYTGPIGITMADVTSSLAKAQSGSGINSKAAVAAFTQTGGLAGDTYTYVLGGTGAGAFTMSSANGVGTLSAGSSPAVGAAGGKLYALSVTATDTTAGLSTRAVPVDVVVGLGSGSNTISLASLPGMVSSTPSFIYDLGGSDRVDGSGMTGNLWLDGGQGADTLTGGSGANAYLYGATNESTVAAMDIVTNFHAAVDLLDFTGLGTRFGAVTALASTATTLAGGSIGWQSSGGNTFVYVNTGGGSVALTAASMKVELLGAVPLTTANFAHL